jgi:hypothetical protein
MKYFVLLKLIILINNKHYIKIDFLNILLPMSSTLKLQTWAQFFNRFSFIFVSLKHFGSNPELKVIDSAQKIFTFKCIQIKCYCWI